MYLLPMRLGLAALWIPASVISQTPTDLAVERRAFAEWLKTSAVSPYAAVYHQPLDRELVMGPGGDPALATLPAAHLTERRSVVRLREGAGERTVPTDRPIAVGAWQLRVSGEAGRRVVTVFGRAPIVEPPGWYPPAGAAMAAGTLEPPQRRESRRMLGLDGIEIEAQLAGTFIATLNGRPLRLTVYRMPEPGSEEEELMIFFRDSTNSTDTYPAGRFLVLQPSGTGRYRADFNRSRNPFCAYNSVFPCPLPWSGNAIASRLEAGERYRK